MDAWLKYHLGAAIHSSCCFMSNALDKRISDVRFGNIPTTSIRRPLSRVNAGTNLGLPQFRCKAAAGRRSFLESREPLCDRLDRGFAVCGDFFDASV